MIERRRHWRMKPPGSPLLICFILVKTSRSFVIPFSSLMTPQLVLSSSPCLVRSSSTSSSSSSSSLAVLSAEAATTTPDEAASAAFHNDMRRVLRTKATAAAAASVGAPVATDEEHGGSKNNNSNCSNINTMERRTKPPVLQDDVDGAQRCLAMLQRLVQTGMATETTYQIVMQAFVARGRARWQSDNEYGVIICAADLLEQLLREMPHPGTATRNLVLAAYANCATPRGSRRYAEKADALLATMMSRDDDTIACLNSDRDDDARRSTTANTDAVPVESILYVLQAYAWQQANMQPGDCAARAEELLEQLASHPDADAASTVTSGGETVMVRAKKLVIEAWSKSLGGAQKCQALFDQLQATPEQRDVETYSNVILAWAKSVGHAETADALLLEMVQAYRNNENPTAEPPLIAFNGVVAAWGRVGRVDKAEEVLGLMQELRESSVGGTFIPNAVSYNSVLHGILKIPDRDAALTKALAMVQYMQDQGVEDKQPAIRPNAFTCHTLMKCWIQSDRADKAERSHELLLRLEELWQRGGGDDSTVPTNRIYNMVINAYAKSNSRDASKVALALLQRMKASPWNINCQPDSITYTSVIECVAKSGDANAPQIATELLREAAKRYEETRNVADKPNVRTYTMTIQTFAKNNGSCRTAQTLLKSLVHEYETTQDAQLKPNTYPFNYVLNCAANTRVVNDKIQAFQIATETFQEIRKSPYIRPDSFSYAFWLKCCNNLLDPGDLRTKCISYAVEECKKDGLVSNEVLTRLLQGSSPALIDTLLTTPANKKRPSFAKQQQSYRSMKVHDLPPSWSRNISKPRTAPAATFNR